MFNIKVITDKMINIEIGGKKDDGTGEFTLSTDIFLRKGNINVQQ